MAFFLKGLAESFLHWYPVLPSRPTPSLPLCAILLPQLSQAPSWEALLQPSLPGLQVISGWSPCQISTTPSEMPNLPVPTAAWHFVAIKCIMLHCLGLALRWGSVSWICLQAFWGATGHLRLGGHGTVRQQWLDLLRQPQHGSEEWHLALGAPLKLPQPLFILSLKYTKPTPILRPLIYCHLTVPTAWQSSPDRPMTSSFSSDRSCLNCHLFREDFPDHPVQGSVSTEWPPSPLRLMTYPITLFYFLHSKYHSLIIPYLLIYLFIVCIPHQNVKSVNTRTLSVMLTTVSSI